MARPHPSAPLSGLTTTAASSLKDALRDRQAEAAALQSNGFLAAAVALRLYALEILLKVRICERLDLDYLPAACKTHDLSLLIVFSGRHRELRGLDDSSPILKSWNLLEAFSKLRLNDLRYEPQAFLSEAEADELFEALDHQSDGVVSWLSK